MEQESTIEERTGTTEQESLANEQETNEQESIGSEQAGAKEAESSFTSEVQTSEAESTVSEGTGATDSEGGKREITWADDLQVENDATVGGTLRAHKECLPKGDRPMKNGNAIYSTGAAYAHTPTHIGVDDSRHAEGKVDVTLLNADGEAVGSASSIPIGMTDADKAIVAEEGKKSRSYTDDRIAALGTVYIGKGDSVNYAQRAGSAVHADRAANLDSDSSDWKKIMEMTGDKYLRKDQDDETQYTLTMGEAEVKKDLTVGGHVLTDEIHSSDSDGDTAMTGRGWVLKNVTDESGTYSVLAVDNLVVRKKMEAAELEIHKKTYVGAQMIASDWGHKILRVDPVDYNKDTGEITAIGMTLFTLPVTIDGVKRMVAFVGRQLSDTETRVELLGDGKGILNRELETAANAFKVYFCESDGTASIEDDLVVGTMGQCQEFNVKERVTHNFTNSYYWGVCLAHGVDEDVRIGDKSVPCVWGVFSHSTDLLTLTSEASGKTFSCYGMEQSRCTFPVAGDDMVGFGCADPWQDTDRCNAIITASKDGENSAPSVISYSGIGRKRGGSVVGTLGTSATPPAYLNIGEQYSIPTDKADSRLDFRISKKAGNVFKGDLYFRGDDGTPHVVGATYMLSADKSVVEYGGDLAVKVYKIIDGKAVSLSSDDLSKAGLSVSLYRTKTDSTEDVTSVYSKLTWSYLTGNSESFSNVVLSLKKGSETLDTMAVYLNAKALPQTEVWRLVAVKELAEINYDIDTTQYSNYAEQGVTGDNTLDKVFVKSGNIALQYYILHQKGDGTPTLFSSMSGTDVGMTLSVTESGADGSILYEYSSDGGNVGATHLHDSLSFTDSSDDAANVAVVTVLLRKDGNILDRREVRTSLATNGVAEMNKKFLAYIYYGTSPDGGTEYKNQSLSNMSGNYRELTRKVGGLETTTQKIQETADKYSREITNGLKSVGFKMDSTKWSVNTWGNCFSWYATDYDAASNDTSKAVMYLNTTTNTLHVKGYIEATGGKIGELELIDDASAIIFEREKDASGNYVEKHKSAMSYKSIQFYIQHTDGRYSIVSPVAWFVEPYSSDGPGKGLQRVEMSGYDPYTPGHTVNILDIKEPNDLKNMAGVGIGYSTNGLAIAKAFIAASGGLAMVCKAYGKIKADGSFDGNDQVNMSFTDCTVNTVQRTDTGMYKCTLRGLPSGLFTVFVRARTNKAGDVMYATLGQWASAKSFWVMTSDDSSRNDSDFEYFVVSFGGY